MWGLLGAPNFNLKDHLLLIGKMFHVKHSLFLKLLLILVLAWLCWFC